MLWLLGPEPLFSGVDGARGSCYLMRQHTRASPCAFVLALSLRLTPSASLLALGTTVLRPSCWPRTCHLLGIHYLLRSKRNTLEESLCLSSQDLGGGTILSLLPRVKFRPKSELLPTFRMEPVPLVWYLDLGQIWIP